jgi:hypothetical protein
MEGKISKICFIIGLVLGHNAFGYIYQLTADSKIINPQTQQRQLVVCLGDYHLKTHPANKDQRLYIESLLKRSVGKKVKFIVEDLSSVNNDGRMICCNFGINCAEGVLGQLANKARALTVAVDNVEYRYCRVAGIGPLLNNLRANPQSFRSSATIFVTSLYKEIIDEIEKIKKYNDGKLLNNLYKQAVNGVHTALLKMDFTKKRTVAEYCTQLQRKSYRQELENICIFDSALIDMNIMHAIATSPDVPLIFVLAGGSHAEQVSSMLKKMGYESLLKTSVATKPMVTKALNSDNASALAKSHPDPIDMAIIERLIEKI